MAVMTLKVLASLLQMHGPDATIQSDHPGIDALLDDVRGQISEPGTDLGATGPLDATPVYFRKAGFIRGGPYTGGFRRGAFRRY
jgi:hypothetical protein